MRDRKHLVSAEVEKLMQAAKGSRNAARDRCLLLLMFRHGLRVSEACGLRLSQVDTESRVLHVARLARLALTDEEVERFRGQLSAILEAVGKVSELDLEGEVEVGHTVAVIGEQGEDISALASSSGTRISCSKHSKWMSDAPCSTA